MRLAALLAVILAVGGAFAAGRAARGNGGGNGGTSVTKPRLAFALPGVDGKVAGPSREVSRSSTGSVPRLELPSLRVAVTTTPGLAL